MSGSIAIEGFLREIYPLDYALTENIFESTIATEGFGDNVAKVQGLIKRFVEWIKKIIKALREKIGKLVGRFRKPLKIVGKNRPDKAMEAWAAPNELMIPEDVYNNAQYLIKYAYAADRSRRLEDMIYDLQDTIKDTTKMFDDNFNIKDNYENIDAIIADEINSIANVGDPSEIIEELRKFEVTQNTKFIKLNTSIENDANRVCEKMRTMVKEVETVIHDIEHYYTEDELKKYFQRVYGSIDNSESAINSKIAHIHKNVSFALTCLNKLLSTYNNAMNLCAKSIQCINMYTR